MSEMFYQCSSLTNLDLSTFNTSKVTDMSDMFFQCSSLTDLDLSKFDTSEVTDMYSMFADCYSLTSIDVSTFDTRKVTDMSYMFSGIYDVMQLNNIIGLNNPNFDTSEVENMEGMFCNTSFQQLDLSNFNTNKVTNMAYMFYGCQQLSTITVGEGWNESNADVTDMFTDCLAQSVTKPTGV